MKSKNKPAQTAQERRHVEKLASLPCVVCGDTGPVEIHEPDQVAWLVGMVPSRPNALAYSERLHA